MTDERPEPPKARAFLVYTRATGWAIVQPFEGQGRTRYHVRPGGKEIQSYDILATAELPPVPETAA